MEEDWKPGEIFRHSGPSQSLITLFFLPLLARRSFMRRRLRREDRDGGEKEDPESRNVVPVKAARADLPQRTSFDALSFAQDRQFGPLEAASQRKTLSW